MVDVIGLDHNGEPTVLHSTANRREAIAWATRYIRYGDFGGYAEIAVKDGNLWPWSRDALDEAEYRAEMFERE